MVLFLFFLVNKINGGKQGKQGVSRLQLPRAAGFCGSVFSPLCHFSPVPRVLASVFSPFIVSECVSVGAFLSIAESHPLTVYPDQILLICGVNAVV